MPSFKVRTCSVATFAPLAQFPQMFPRIDRSNPMGSAADYVRFVTEMCVPSAAVSSFTSAPSLRPRRQHDLCRLGPRITFEQFSQKMFEIITANQFYDHHHWSPGPLGHRDPVFQNIMFAPWSMVRLFAFALPLSRDVRSPSPPPARALKPVKLSYIVVTILTSRPLLLSLDPRRVARRTAK